MKKTLSFLLLILPLLVYSQTREELDNLYNSLKEEGGRNLHFSFVDTIPSKSKSDLYFLAKSFFVEKYTFSNEVIQLDDKDRGVVAGKAAFTSKYGSATITYYYYLKIECRDERYKVELKDVSYTVSYPDQLTYPAEAQLKNIYDEYQKNLKDKKPKETKAKKSVRKSFDKDLHLITATYTILEGFNENLDNLFVEIERYMINNSFNKSENDW